MEEQQILERFFQTVAFNYTHRHYKHVTKKAVLYNQLVAGVGLDKLLKQYVRREDKNLFDQRVALTHHIVTAVSKNLLSVFYKIPRSNSARRILTYTTKDPDKLTNKLEAILKKFWGITVGTTIWVKDI